MYRLKILFTIIICTLTITLFSYPSNSWKHVKSKNFTVSYNNKTENRVKETVNIAEDIAEKIGSYFGYDAIKGRISIVLYDHDDFTNGAAYWNEPLVKIYCRKTDSLWRGEKNNLRNLLSHELSHIYSIRIMKSRSYINFGVSMSNIPKGVNGYARTSLDIRMLPTWFIEGIAQAGSHKYGADSRDSLREMLLRDAYFNNKLLTLSEMSRFEGTSREYELAYNQGYDLMLFMLRTYQDVKLDHLCDTVKKEGFKSAVSICYKKSIEKIYEEWLKSLKTRFIAKSDQTNLEPFYKHKKRILVTEIRSVKNGKFVIANWGHDYNRFDLYLFSEKKNKYSRIAADTGKVLKEDNSTGDIYYNKKTYSHKTGSENFDIFRYKPNKKTSRITYNKRCMAFDVENRTIIYAYYNNGNTEIISQSPEGDPKVLATFNYKFAVYDISIINNEKAILSIGTGKNVRIAILEGNNLTYLWPGLDKDIMDAAYAGKNRIVFASTINNVPELYWCDLNNQNIWYKIETPEGGARFPVVEDNSIYCSIYNKGHHRIYRINDPFKKINKIYTTAFFAEKNDKEKSLENIHYKKSAANVPIGVPYFSFFYQLEKSELSEGHDIIGNQVSTQIAYSIKNAPGNVEFGGMIDLKFPVGYDHYMDIIYPSGEVWLKLHLWQFRLTESFYCQNNYYLSESDDKQEYITTNETYYSVNSRIEYQPFRNNFLQIDYYYRWLDSKFLFKLKDENLIYNKSHNNTLEIDNGTIYRNHTCSLNWMYYYSKSEFDPADMGTTYFSTMFEASFQYFEYPYTHNAASSYFNGNATVYRIDSAISKGWLLVNSKLHLNLGIDGYVYFDGIKDNKIAFAAYSSIGNHSYFSGYSALYGVRRLARGTFELRFNPFINIFDGISWYERMSFGLKLETGYCNYFDGKMTWALPVSIEGAIRFSFYMWPERRSSLFIKCAGPLNKLHEEDDSSYNIYFGITF